MATNKNQCERIDCDDFDTLADNVVQNSATIWIGIERIRILLFSKKNNSAEENFNSEDLSVLNENAENTNKHHESDSPSVQVSTANANQSPEKNFNSIDDDFTADSSVSHQTAENTDENCDMDIESMQYQLPNENVTAADHIADDFFDSISTPSQAKKREHQCTYCKLLFSRKYYLDRHKRNHTGEKPFQCDHDDCNKKFSRPDYLIKHKLTHTKEKSFECDVCSKKFGLNETLARHKRIHVPKCEKKQKQNAVNNGQKMHEKPCISASDLSRHEVTHTGQKPFECIVCSKGFNDKSDATRHMRTHVSKKKFKCTFRTKSEKTDSKTMCGKRYKHEASLFRHSQKQHIENARYQGKIFKCSACALEMADERYFKYHMNSKC